MTSNSGDGLAASAAGTAPSPLRGADGSARGRSSSSDGLEDSDGEEGAKSHSQKELVLPEEEDDDEDDDEEDEEEGEEEAEEELEDVEGLLFARFLGRLAGGLAARTSSTPAAVNRNLLPSRSS
jgi:hypothetical protein